MDLNSLKIKIFADGADQTTILTLANNPLIQGFTTNPTLMRKDGVLDYKKFALTLLESIPNKPISFEIFADEFDEMEEQARAIAAFGKNVYVKIPVTNTKGEFTGPLISRLSNDGIPLNVTALFTVQQVQNVIESLHRETPAVISVFSGRIADTGVDPTPTMIDCLKLLKGRPQAELLWASCRELFNIVEADRSGCHIITVPIDMIKKLNLFGKNLDEYSLETVKMFHKDAMLAGYEIETTTALV